MKSVQIRPEVNPNLSNLVHDEKLWLEIQAFDLGVVTETVAKRNPEYESVAEKLELECKRFMYLAAVAPNLELAPTKPIDDYWHQFILFTEKYTEFCSRFNGYFVNHNPLAGPDHRLLFEQTQAVVLKLFGKFQNNDLWFLPMPATSCKCNSGKNRILIC